MVDYQFLGMVAVILAVVTRGSLLPVVAVTGLIAVVTLAYEAGTRWYRRRHPRPAQAASGLKAYRTPRTCPRSLTSSRGPSR